MNDMIPKGLRITICKHFSAELEAILREDWFHGITGDIYPGFCGHPQRRSLDGNSRTAATPEREPTILILGGCYCGAEQPIMEGECVKVLHPANCLYLVAGETVIDKLVEEKALIITPSWLDTWRMTLDAWKIDKKTARAFFRKSSAKLVLLDTGTVPDYEKALHEFSRVIDLPVEIRHVGLDFFRLFLMNELRGMQTANIERELSAVRQQIDQKEANSLMVIELLREIGEKTEGPGIVKGIADIFSMLFAQASFCFLPYENGKFAEPLTAGSETSERFLEDLREWSEQGKEEDSLTQDGSGFFIRVSRKNILYGCIGLRGFNMPQNLKRYYPKAKGIARLCGMLFENIRLIEKIDSLANTDSLTDLNNRRCFYEQAQKEFDRARRYRRTVTVIMLDIDFFKSVNDTYGHAAGDAVLRNIADCIRNQLRATDFAGRLGGEEFAIALPETEQRNAHIFAERLRRLIESTPAIVDGESIGVTVSLGTASLEALSKDDSLTLDTLIQRGDEAMYTAKKTGRNRTVDWQGRI